MRETALQPTQGRSSHWPVDDFSNVFQSFCPQRGPQYVEIAVKASVWLWLKYTSPSQNKSRDWCETTSSAFNKLRGVPFARFSVNGGGGSSREPPRPRLSRSRNCAAPFPHMKRISSYCADRSRLQNLPLSKTN